MQRPTHSTAENRPATANLAVEIEVGTEPIRGAVADTRGTSQPFRGWLELAGALEAVRAAGSREDAPANSASGAGHHNEEDARSRG